MHDNDITMIDRTKLASIKLKYQLNPIDNVILYNLVSFSSNDN